MLNNALESKVSSKETSSFLLAPHSLHIILVQYIAYAVPSDGCRSRDISSCQKNRIHANRPQEQDREKVERVVINVQERTSSVLLSYLSAYSNTPWVPLALGLSSSFKTFSLVSYFSAFFNCPPYSIPKILILLFECYFAANTLQSFARSFRCYLSSRAETMGSNHAGLTELPEGIFSLLDTDLYKLTMQCAILKYLPDVRECLAFW